MRGSIGLPVFGRRELSGLPVVPDSNDLAPAAARAFRHRVGPKLRHLAVA